MNVFSTTLHHFFNDKNGKTGEMSPAEKERRLKRIDRLAVERTLLANERTLLAYVRTAFSLLLLALALVKFFEDPLLVYLGGALFAGGFLICLFGVYSFYATRRKVKLY